MPWYAYILYGIFIIVCALLIGVVLLQPGKGDAAIFGGGAQTAFGPRGAQKPLERITFGAAAAFMILSFVFTIPGITSPRSAAAGIQEAPAPAPKPKTDEKNGQSPAPGGEENKPKALDVNPESGAKPPEEKPKADDKKPEEGKKPEEKKEDKKEEKKN
jgi:preprotein translocase subunit SecG